MSYLFRKLQAVKDVIRQISKRSRFGRPFHEQYGKRSQTLLKSEGQHLFHIYWSLWNQLSWKKSLLVICKILGLFLNTLSADDKYSFLNRDNLRQSIEMQLSKKQKTFFQFFYTILKSRMKFEHFEKKMTLIAGFFWKLQTARNVVRRMSKRSRFRISLHKKHGKWSQKQMKSEVQDLFQIYWSLFSVLSWKKSLFVIWTMWNNQFRCSYLRNKKLFSILFYIFEI